jgi:hypothetical protein
MSSWWNKEADSDVEDLLFIEGLREGSRRSKRKKGPSAEDARQEGALLAERRRLYVASSPAASVGEGARRLRCRGAPPARPESGDTPRRGGARQPALVEALARSRRSSGRTPEDPLAPAG